MNRLKKETKIRAQAQKKERRSPRNFFTLLFSGEWVQQERVFGGMPFVLFLFFLSLVYIAHRQYAEDVARDINKGYKQLKELKWEYITTKAELMFLSKQTEVAERVKKIGIKESVEPPVKIEISEEELEEIKGK